MVALVDAFGTRSRSTVMTEAAASIFQHGLLGR
jgi:hypothetical protein